MKGSFSLGRAERLRRKIDFQRVFSQGESFRDGLFFFYVLKRPPSPSSPLKKVGDSSIQIEGGGIGVGNRIGFIVSKRVSKKAVTRNRVRRLLWEVYRQNKGKLKEGRDLVLVAKEGAGELSFLEMQEVLLELFRKAGLIKNE